MTGNKTQVLDGQIKNFKFYNYNRHRFWFPGIAKLQSLYKLIISSL